MIQNIHWNFPRLTRLIVSLIRIYEFDWNSFNVNEMNRHFWGVFRIFLRTIHHID